ncbi:MAG: O-acetylserine (Thiol) lyase [Rhodospirillales bacterium]|nr:O-acetylserine (Thiol) lyase [Rhodospirillales bacterium]
MAEFATTAPDVSAAIGRTPLIRLAGPSEATGCEIYGKAEFMNPGGSIKDRTALGILDAAERAGRLKPGGVIVEGTAGNTGIGLTMLARARHYRTLIVMPETQSREKIEALRVLGAELELVQAVPYADPGNYVRVARRRAEEIPGAILADQFDNLANRDIHAATTGVEIWEEMAGRIDAFVSAAGTGGTIAGVGQTLKQRDPKVRVILADPHGSGLYDWIKTGTPHAEGSSITEGIGQGRVTENLAVAPIDDAVRIDDQTAMDWCWRLLRDEGLNVGTSTGINVGGAIEVARQLGPGHRIVTVLADGGQRYASKMFDAAFLKSKGIKPPDWLPD